MLTTVTLHGALGQAVGRDVWTLAIESVGEAIRAIEAQTGKLIDYLKTAGGGHAEYRVLLDGKDHVSVEQLKYSRRRFESIEIIPVPTGSGGVWEAVIGVVLIVVGVVLEPYLGPFANIIIMVGVSMLIGGVSQMLFPPHNTAPLAPDKKHDPHKSVSDNWNGATNTAAQGECVPVMYGEGFIGGAFISAELTTVSLQINTPIGDPQTPNPVTAYLSHSNWALLRDHYASV